MTFHAPQLLWLLLVPIALAVVELWRRRANTQRLSHPKILRAEAGMRELELRGNQSTDTSKSARAKFRWALYLGMMFIVAALARPQWGQLDEPVFDQAREIMIALDLSRSMLAPDVRPSRLDRAKLLVTSLLERLAGERVGLIVFSGTAFLQSPLSSDYEILNEFLPSLNPDYLPEGGTNYHALIENALSAFGASSSADRFLIVLSDGEATDENWRSAADELTAKGIRVIGLGVGTAQGSILPDGHGGYVKDDRGAVVMSKLEPATLQALASITHGVYKDASSWIDLAQLIQSTVDAGRKGQFREERHARLVERFQWPLAAGIALLFWSFLRDFPVRPRLREVKLRRTKEAALSIPAPTKVAEVASVALALATTLAVANHAPAAENSAAEPLSQLVGQFSARDALGAKEYAELARTTVTYAERQTSAQQPVVEGSIHDGLAAVAAGEAADPKSADWAKLRRDLERFLEKKDPPPQQQQQQQKQDQKDQQNQKDQQQQQQQQKDSESQKKDSSDSSSQNSPDQKQKSERDNASKSGDDKQPEKQDKPAERKPDSAFGDMSKKQDDEQKEQPQNPGSPETQKVGGTPEKSDKAPTDPAMVVPLQRLQQVREQDSPVRLQELMRGNQQQKPDPASKGKTW